MQDMQDMALTTGPDLLVKLDAVALFVCGRLGPSFPGFQTMPIDDGGDAPVRHPCEALQGCGFHQGKVSTRRSGLQQPEGPGRVDAPLLLDKCS